MLDELDIPRRRVGFDGRILQAAAFKVDYEIDSANHLEKPTPPWRDVYIDITQLEEAQFRYGQFKMPFSLDENTGSVDLDFAYRSAAATLLAPSRARGWMVHGDTLGQFFGYEYGVFTTDGSNAIVHTSEKRVNAGQTTVWRITSEPLHGMSSPLADVHVGYAQTGASGCSGTITAGEQKTCTITNDDVPATLTVIKHVVNDNGRSKTAGDFTLTIAGVTASGGNSFAGSESGVTKTLLSVVCASCSVAY